MGEKKIMLGNAAIARGCYEAGVKVSAAYPGTPSTEISENMVQYKGDIYSEWSPNEKVATEVAIGASFAGVRSIVSMKHVGVNVASDPLFTAAYTGVNGGMVLVAADDPGMYSSQNEQDSRLVARTAMIPVVEPSDSQESYLNRTVVMLSQAFRDNLSITFICLNTFSSALLQHGSWSEYNTLYMLRHKLMIEGVTEAASLITAYKFSIVSVNGTRKLQIFQNLFVIGFCFLVVRSFLIFNCHWAKYKTFFVNIHSYVNCVIIHLITSICMR